MQAVLDLCDRAGNREFEADPAPPQAEQPSPEIPAEPEPEIADDGDE